MGTAEPWNVWLEHPDLAQHVDFIGVHLLPYWEGVPVEIAVDYSIEQFHKVQKAFPNKDVIIAEVGWPSRGRTPVPLGRQGTAWEVAARVVFLLSDDASYITGQLIAVEGGLSTL